MTLTRQQYIDKYKDSAIKAVKGTTLFPSVLMVQGIVESNNGNSTLSSKYKNHFGIKADSSWKGKTVTLPTKEFLNGQWVTINDKFRVYDNDWEGFRDRVKFLQDNPRYTKAGVFSAKTPEEQIEALKRAGYATDPNYVQILKDVIKRYNLTALDKLVEFTKKNIGLIVLAVVVILLSITALYIELYQGKSVVNTVASVV